MTATGPNPLPRWPRPLPGYKAARWERVLTPEQLSACYREPFADAVKASDSGS